jgi:hypothetical protein
MTAQELVRDELIGIYDRQMSKRDKDYLDAYDLFVNATRDKTEAMIIMGRAGFTEPSCAAYRLVKEEWFTARKGLDDAFFAKIEGGGMYAQIVRLISEEILDQLPAIKARLDKIEALMEWDNTK